MNGLYEELNIKKVVIAILILLLLIVSIIVFAISKVGTQSSSSNDNKVSNVKNPSSQSTTAIFEDSESRVSIELPKKYNLTQSFNSEYLIKLTSEENVDVYVSKIERIDGRNLETIARADKTSYLESYNAYSNLSDLKELDVQGNRAFTYSFHYLDENMNKAFYIQVTLLEVGEEIYFFDVDFPLEDLVLYTNLVSDTLSNFKIVK